MFDVIGTNPESGLWHIPGLRQSMVGQCGANGAEMVSALHRAAHDLPANLPALSRLNQWRQEAFALTSLLAQYDSEWYVNYWDSKFRSGVKIPRQLATLMRQQGVSS